MARLCQEVFLLPVVKEPDDQPLAFAGEGLEQGVYAEDLRRLAKKLAGVSKSFLAVRTPVQWRLITEDGADEALAARQINLNERQSKAIAVIVKFIYFTGIICSSGSFTTGRRKTS